MIVQRDGNEIQYKDGDTVHTIEPGDTLVSRAVGQLTYDGINDDGEHTIVGFRYPDGSELTEFYETVRRALWHGNLEHEQQPTKHMATWRQME